MKPARILWIDCLGGLAGGVLVILFSGWISRLEGLPHSIVLFMGIANLSYGSYSLFVATRLTRGIRLVGSLAMANMAWMPICLIVVWLHWETLTLLGCIHVLGEGIYVGILGGIEWSIRKRLVV